MASEVEKRLKVLEDKVANIKDYKKMYEAEKAERERLQKSTDNAGAFREALLRFLGFDSLPSNLGGSSTGKETLNLNHRELVVNLSHSQKELSMTTETVAGQILYCASVELPSEGFTDAELVDALKERGWNVGQNTRAPTLGGLVKKGSLIRLDEKPVKYRLPQKVKLNVIKTDGED